MNEAGRAMCGPILSCSQPRGRQVLSLHGKRDSILITQLAL
jgi:hypothetical protein